MVSVTTTREEAALNGVKGLIYGRAGVGKTRLAITAPHPIIISSESGLLSLRKYDLPVIKMTTVKELQEIHNWLALSHEATQYWTVFIDSISEVAEVVLSSAKRQVTDPRQAYSKLLEDTTLILRSFRDLPRKHVIMIAKQDRVLDEVTKITSYGPMMPGAKLGSAIPYMFDEVLRMGLGVTDKGEEYRLLQTKPDIQYDAKDRSDALDPIEPPDLTHIFNKIIGD